MRIKIKIATTLDNSWLINYTLSKDYSASSYFSLIISYLIKFTNTRYIRKWHTWNPKIILQLPTNRDSSFLSYCKLIESYQTIFENLRYLRKRQNQNLKKWYSWQLIETLLSTTYCGLIMIISTCYTRKSQNENFN